MTSSPKEERDRIHSKIAVEVVHRVMNRKLNDFY